MRLHKFRRQAAFVSLSWMLTAPSLAAEGNPASPVKPGVAVTSDRIWRGLSDTRGRPGVIGEVKWQTLNGPLAGIWIASAGDERYDTSMHILPFVGYTITRRGFNAELAYLRHVRPAEGANLDFGEFNVSIGTSVGRFSGRLGLFYCPDFYSGGSSTYEYALAGLRLTKLAGTDVSAFVQLGASQFSIGALRDYPDWKLGFRASRGKWYGSIALSGAEPTVSPALLGSSDAGTRFSATLGYSF